MNAFNGRCAVVLGDDINTDLIYPGQYLKISDPAEMARHALEGVKEDLWREIHEGDVVVAGRNFGGGSSRTQSVACLKALGVKAVIASSFARSFFRNSVNQGLPAIECPDWQDPHVGETVALDLSAQTLTVGDRTYRFPAYPPLLMSIIEAGGLTNLGKRITAGEWTL